MSIPSKSTDLVKLNDKKSNLPIKFDPKEVKNALELVDKDLLLKNREDVKKYLPDILGRVLARIWIDKSFKDNFKSNPKKVLNALFEQTAVKSIASNTQASTYPSLTIGSILSEAITEDMITL